MCLVFGSGCLLGHLASLPGGPFASISLDWLPYLVVLGQHSKAVKVDMARSLDLPGGFGISFQRSESGYSKVSWGPD